MLASVKGLKEVLKILLNGVWVDIYDNFGRTSLMLAAYRGHEGAVEELIKGGADVCVANREGWTALKCARENKHEKIVELLKNAGAN